MNEEKIFLDWTLSQEEKEVIIERSRGIENRLKYGMQLCHVRSKGRFVEDWGGVSIKILNHLSKQLELGVVHRKLVEGNKNTESRIRLEVKKFLGFSDFSFKGDRLISDFLDQNPILISEKKEMTREVEKHLLESKYILPGKSQLMRFVHSQYQKKQSEVFKEFASSITGNQKKYLKSIYNDKGLLPGIKVPIGEVNVKNIREKIDIVEQLLGLQLEDLPWKLIHPSYSEKLSRLIHKYDHSSIRRISPETRRDVMMICYLYESQKVSDGSTSK